MHVSWSRPLRRARHPGADSAAAQRASCMMKSAAGRVVQPWILEAGLKVCVEVSVFDVPVPVHVDPFRRRDERWLLSSS